MVRLVKLKVSINLFHLSYVSAKLFVKFTNCLRILFWIKRLIASLQFKNINWIPAGVYPALDAGRG